MMDLMFTFEQSPWETFLKTKGLYDTVSAGELLALLEGEDDQALEDAFLQMEEGCMELSIRDLPKAQASGEAALRLRREAELKDLRPELFEEDDPLRLYLEEVAMTPACGDEQVLAQEAAKGKEDAMVNLTNLGLARVISLAGLHTGYGVLLLDLIQEGSLGLWQAIRNYRGGDYASFRDRWINLYLAKAVTMQARQSGVGQKMRQAMEDYKQVDERLLSDLGRNPTLEEIALELHIGVEQAMAVKGMLDNARLLAQAKRPEEPEEEKAEEEKTE